MPASAPEQPAGKNKKMGGMSIGSRAHCIHVFGYPYIYIYGYPCIEIPLYMGALILRYPYMGYLYIGVPLYQGIPIWGYLHTEVSLYTSIPI